jgi:hypothetical protein
MVKTMTTVTIKNGDFYYVVPMHEFSRYWLPVLNQEMIFLELPKVPSDIPKVSKLGALKRGKGVKRVVKAYEQKGSGKHEKPDY